MIKILVPVDGSECALAAVRHAAFLYREGSVAEIVLVNVQPPLERSRARAFHSLQRLRDVESRGGEAALCEAQEILEDSGVPYVPIIALGPLAETIARTAEENNCDGILLGTGLWSGITSFVGGGLPAGVMRRTSVPLTVIKARGSRQTKLDARMPLPQGQHAHLKPRLVILPPGR
ncbi:universal stress protein [Cupriavidus necator]|nr:universal stress protein [Cupriavidus necator]